MTQHVLHLLFVVDAETIKKYTSCIGQVPLLFDGPFSPSSFSNLFAVKGLLGLFIPE